MKRLVILLCLFSISFLTLSQAKIRRFPASINNPSINVWAPFISLDGSTLLFTSDYADDGTLVYISERQTGDWKQPVELPKHLNTRLNFVKGYSLSPDGKIIYITSIKSGGVGGYDIWYSEWKGTSWSELNNLFAPLNSKSNEGCPTFTPDGNTVYFMRCEKMNMQTSNNCKIFVATKKNTGQWNEPVELPDYINTGNSQTPRIMADGETLLFSSDKLSPKKGGMDLYVAKLKNRVWSSPLPLDVVNTDKDDQYVSVQFNGRYVLKEAPGKFKSEILEYLIPDELRPRGVMKVEGFVRDETGAATPAYISVINLFDNQRVFNGRPSSTDGSFLFYLQEGGAYELSIDHEQSAYTYYSKQYDLLGDTDLRNDKLNVVLKPLAIGDELALDAITFKENSSELNNVSGELRRLSRLLKSAPQFNFEVQVLLSGYHEDSIQSDPDLTEFVIDSTRITLEALDTLGQMITRDSMVVKTTYHNDRTEKQASAIIDELVALGVDRSNLSIFVNARPEEMPEKRRTTVRLVARRRK